MSSRSVARTSALAGLCYPARSSALQQRGRHCCAPAGSASSYACGLSQPSLRRWASHNPSIERTAFGCRSCRTLCDHALHMKAACSLSAKAVARYRFSDGLWCASGVAVLGGVRLCATPERARPHAQAVHAQCAVSALAGAHAGAVLLLRQERLALRGRRCYVRAGSASSCACGMRRPSLRRWASHNLAVERTAFGCRSPLR